MSKKSGAIILTVIGASLIAPMTIMAYGMVFGHTYSNSQINTAGGMALIAIFVFFPAAYLWRES